MDLSLDDIFTRKEDLHTDLVPHIQDRSFGKMIHHPLIIYPMYHEHMNALINAQYAMKQQMLSEYKAKGDIIGLIHLRERPYRFETMMEMIMDKTIEKEEDFHAVIRTVWVDSENICEFYDEWLSVWNIVNPDKVMTDQEKAYLAKQPEVMTIYRGFDMQNGTLEGMSWTTNKAKAKWFALRFASKEPTIAKASINKKDVKAYFMDRNEFEIVVNPDDLDIKNTVTVNAPAK